MLALLFIGLLPVLVSTQPTAQRRFAVALIWLLTLTYSIVPSYATFFPQHDCTGYMVWFGLSLLLASTYCYAKGGLWTVGAILIQSIPPIGIVNVVSPLSASGLFFPGWGLVGVALYLVSVGLLTQKTDRLTHEHSPLLVLLALSLTSNMIAKAYAPTQTEWHGINTTHILPAGNDAFGALRNARSVITSADNNSKVLVYPEAVLDNMYDGTVNMLSDNIPEGQTWLIGAEDGKTDSVYAISRNSTAKKLFESAMPMPISMWQPFNAKSYIAGWWEPARIIDGKRVWSSICYEQVLPWVWLEAGLQRPDLILLQSNGWWASATNSAPEIQSAQAWAWVRLLGVPSVSATNTR